MVSKEMLHLGQRVLVGAEKREAVIDGLTQTVAGVVYVGGGYDFCEYEELELEEAACDV